MSDVSTERKRRPRCNRSIYQVHYSLPRVRDDNMAKPFPLVSDGASCHTTKLQTYGLQVAGHMKTENERYLGVLQCNNGTILKPIIKETQKREIDFYNRLESTEQPDLIELKTFVPKYYGCRKFTYNGFEQDYIVLEDLCERMLEPCIMDVKIGRRTWDPLASEEKIRSEQSKYTACRREFAFCIPGYQVYKLATGKLHKYNKDYGKKLQGVLVNNAFRNFLNGMGATLCRALILQFLSELWKIHRWASHQTNVRLYSSSLLLIYDAAKLRECCREKTDVNFKCRSLPSTRRKSIHTIDSSSSFSGQISSSGPVYKPVQPVPITSMTLAQASFAPPHPINSPWSEALEKLNLNHSFDHNYEDKLSKIKMNYRALLDQLSAETPNHNPWGTVKIIDFAHAFFNEDEEMAVDDNFREGVDNLVAIFEEFLKETDDQVF